MYVLYIIVECTVGGMECAEGSTCISSNCYPTCTAPNGSPCPYHSDIMLCFAGEHFPVIGWAMILARFECLLYKVHHYM